MLKMRHRLFNLLWRSFDNDFAILRLELNVHLKKLNIMKISQENIFRIRCSKRMCDLQVPSERNSQQEILHLFTFGRFCVILLMLAPFFPIMNLWSQASALTSRITTLFAYYKIIRKLEHQRSRKINLSIILAIKLPSNRLR